MRPVPLAAALLAPLLQAQPAAAQSCLPYEPESVTLTGHVRRVMAYGPTGFGESPRTDAREPDLDLVLDRPACLRPGPAGQDAEPALRDVQIIFMDVPFDRTIEGRRVRITGALMQAETGHHHTKVLIQARRIERP